MCFLIVVGTASPRSRCWQGCFPRRPLSLACGRSPSCCLFTHCSSVRADPGASLWVLVSSLDASQIGLGSILRSSFYLSYFFFYYFLIGGKLLYNGVLITSLKASSPNTVTFWGIWNWGFNIGIWREHNSYQNLGEKERRVTLWLV